MKHIGHLSAVARFSAIIRAGICVCVCGMAFVVFAQQPPPSAPIDQEEQKKKQELEKRALAMLDQLIEEARAFRLPENRCWVLATGSSLLWERDEKRARALWTEASAIYSQLAQQPHGSPGAMQPQFRWQLYQLRQQLLQLVAAHDPQLALDFLAATRPNANDQAPGHYNPDQETYLEASLTQQIANRDPRRALERAEAMIKAGKPLQLVFNIIHSLHAKDPEAAQKLAGVIVARLQAEEPLHVDSAAAALNMLMAFPLPDSDGNGNQPAHLFSAEAARAVIERVAAGVQAALSEAARNYDQNRRHQALNLLQQLKGLAQLIEKHSPASLSALKRFWAEAEQIASQNMDPGQRNWELLNQLAAKGSVDLLIEAASKAPPEMQLHYFQRAAQLSSNQGDQERARQIIREHVTNGEQRREALRDLDRMLLTRRINDKRFEEAWEAIKQLDADRDQILWLLQLATAAQNAERKDLARKLLDEVWGMIGGEPETSPQFFVQMQAAGVYARIEPGRSFEIIEGTTDRLNELFSAAATLGSFEQQGAFRNEVIIYSGSSAANYLQQYVQPLSELSAIDLARVQNLIGRLARLEMRASLALAVVRNILSGSAGGAMHLHSGEVLIDLRPVPRRRLSR